ncbi:hypothetical protein F2P81_022638 [Scophthalmus maximus]|uniref:Transmembrane protein 106 C-terminal domain-containing protein n=1 Tax=Scophthalmus maximus TaxID=52904 RepID=A0A6A4RYQ5_SCOMX|nr:hypothetical protein F2P81_022638 [Scophthalmus maximus]
MELSFRKLSFQTVLQKPRRFRLFPLDYRSELFLPKQCKSFFCIRRRRVDEKLRSGTRRREEQQEEVILPGSFSLRGAAVETEHSVLCCSINHKGVHVRPLTPDDIFWTLNPGAVRSFVRERERDTGTKDMDSPGHDGPDLTNGMEKTSTLKHFPPYGSMGGNSTGDTCPTCQADQLVAVISCNDVRLKPRRTKLYVCASMAACVCLCCLILFFLFPRSITLTPVSVLSVMVYFHPDTVNVQVTNLINVTNENFVPVQIVDFNVQSVVADIVLGKSKIFNMTAIPSRSQKSFLLQVELYQHSHAFHGVANDAEHFLPVPHGAAVPERLRVHRLWHQLDDPSSRQTWDREIMNIHGRIGPLTLWYRMCER